MANLLQDLLPDAPREAGILTAAAQRNVAGTLRVHAEHGLDGATSVRLAATAFADSTAFAPAACEWVARELAVAMGLLGEQTAIVAIPTGDDAAISPSGPPTPMTPRAVTTPPAQPAPLVPTGPMGPPGPPARTGPPAEATWPGPAPAAVAPRSSRPLRAALLTVGLVVILAGAVVGGYELAGSSGPGAAAAGHHPRGHTAPAAARSASTPVVTPTSTASGSTPPSSASPAVTPPTSTPPTSTGPVSTAPVGPGATWIAQLASVSQAAGTAQLDQVLAKVQAQVPQALVLDSSQYASLRPGYWVIYYQGNFTSGIQALDFCAAQGLSSRNQCIGRYLSHNPADFGYQCYPPAGSPSGNCYRRE